MQPVIGLLKCPFQARASQSFGDLPDMRDQDQGGWSLSVVTWLYTLISFVVRSTEIYLTPTTYILSNGSWLVYKIKPVAL